MGSFLGHFWRQNGSRNRAKKTMISGNVFLRLLVVLGTHFCHLFVNILCPEAIVDEKGEHVFSVESCTFSKDLQGPQGTENRKINQKLTSWDMPFFGRRFGTHFCHFWVTFWSTLAPRNGQQTDTPKTTKNKGAF